MKLPPPPAAATDAMSDIDALLAAADAHQAAKKTGWQDQGDEAPEPDVDLPAFARRFLLWFAPARRAREPAVIDLADGEQWGDEGKAEVFRSPYGAADGPWIALRLSDSAVPAQVVAAFLKAYGEELEGWSEGAVTVCRGHEGITESVLGLLYERAVQSAGKLLLVPHNSEQTDVLDALAGEPGAKAYTAALVRWREGERGQHKPKPQPTPVVAAQAAVDAASKAVADSIERKRELEKVAETAMREARLARRLAKRHKAENLAPWWAFWQGPDKALAKLEDKATKLHKARKKADAATDSADDEVMKLQRVHLDAQEVLKAAVRRANKPA